MKKLDFLSEKIINRFKRSSISEARGMLINGKNISNIKILFAINDIAKLNLLIEFGLSVNTKKTIENESHLYRSSYNFHLLDNISNEKLKFFIEHGLDFKNLANGSVLLKLNKPENLKTYIEYVESKNEMEDFISTYSKWGIPYFIKNCVIQNNFESLKIISSYFQDPNFYKLAIEEGLQHLKLDSLYFLYKNNIFNIEFLQQEKFYTCLINNLKKEIRKTNDSISQRKSNDFFKTKSSIQKESISQIKQKSLSASFDNQRKQKLENELYKIQEMFSNDEDFYNYFVLRAKQEIESVMNKGTHFKKKRL